MFCFKFVGQAMVKGITKGPKERCWSGDGQEEAKDKKEVFSEYVGQVMVKSVKKRHFSEYVDQVMAKDTTAQKIVMKSLEK